MSCNEVFCLWYMVLEYMAIQDMSNFVEPVLQLEYCLKSLEGFFESLTSSGTKVGLVKSHIKKIC